jgi:hypothetical protein
MTTQVPLRDRWDDTTRAAYDRSFKTPSAHADIETVMDDTTDTLERPGFPPPPSASSAPPPPPAPPASWPGQISQAAPMLPVVTAKVPRPASVDASPFTMAMFESPATSTSARRTNRGGIRRGVSWLLVLAVVAGLGYAGVTYGPDLVDEFTGADALDGPAAPLVYPVPTGAPVAVRTATFTVSEPDSFGGTQHYEVTADFESGVSHVVVPRTDTPDLEILTLWDQAFIRRIDEPTWYTLPRGDFPIDFSLGRGRWIRTLDELVPPAFRQLTTIDQANESSVGTEPARRLVVSTDPVRLLQAQNAATSPPADGSSPPAAPLPPGVTVQPGLDGVESLTMEIWVDDAGIVRKSVLPVELGGETITVTSVSPDAWEPMFPTPDAVQPLTAQALFRLGI